MTFDDLRSPWQESNRGAISREQREDLVSRVSRKVERMGAVIFRRDMIETVAAVFVVYCFGKMFLRIDDLVAKFGAAIVIIGACYVVYKLHRTRMSQKAAQMDASVRKFCETELERLDRQIQLIRSVLWWYVSPIIVGVNLVFFSSAGAGISSLVYLVCTLLLSWGIYLLNQRAVAKSLAPLHDELSELLRELGEGE